MKELPIFLVTLSFDVISSSNSRETGWVVQRVAWARFVTLIVAATTTWRLVNGSINTHIRREMTIIRIINCGNFHSPKLSFLIIIFPDLIDIAGYSNYCHTIKVKFSLRLSDWWRQWHDFDFATISSLCLVSLTHSSSLARHPGVHLFATRILVITWFQISGQENLKGQHKGIDLGMLLMRDVYESGQDTRHLVACKKQCRKKMSPNVIRKGVMRLPFMQTVWKVKNDASWAQRAAKETKSASCLP